MPVSPARAIAFEILTRVETHGAWAADALHARLAPAPPAAAARQEAASGASARPVTPGARLKREDAALATELVFGVLRWRRLLDFLIERQANRPTAVLDGDVRQALRLGTYQLLFLDRIPASAAVNESVELTKLGGKRSAAPLVNAVLRRLPRGPYRPEEIDRTLPLGLGRAERWGILYSHPDWLVARWLGALGPERTRALLEANNRPLPVACAVLDLDHATEVAETLREEGLRVEPGRLLAAALIVRGGSVVETTAFREGWLTVQDEASQAVPLLLGVEPGQSVLDLCAAPGNKTLRLARAAGPEGFVVAADIHRHRLRAVRSQLRRAGSSGVALVALDATRPLPFARQFQRILVDAPCSGTGTLARNPEIRWRLTPADLKQLPRRQEAILRHALEALAPGGRLVYATCSLEPEENEQVVRRVLQARRDVRLGAPPASFAAQLASGIEATRLFDSEGFFRTLPPETPSDGFFAAILERP
jgi:16S rRNA (cytosine967-C5)-methyltransferase